MSARRRAVLTEDLPPGPGYADAFAAALPPGDARSGEQLLRSGLEGAPPWLRVVVRVAQERVLGLRLARPLTSPEHVLGWRVVQAEADEVRLEAESPLLRATLVGRRDDVELSLTTVLGYRHPRRARALWALVGPVHRRVAPYLLDRAVAAE